MDSLNGFVVFVQVAETRSFVAAGRLLGVSASAVGKSVARLEEKLGVRLFHRSTRSVTLTAEGTLFLERSRRILAEIEAAELELSQASAVPRGRLRSACRWSARWSCRCSASSCAPIPRSSWTLTSPTAWST
ncbi:LysR family transcriptional regulator [Azospirillum argentinense]